MTLSPGALELFMAELDKPASAVAPLSDLFRASPEAARGVAERRLERLDADHDISTFRSGPDVLDRGGPERRSPVA